MGQTGITGTTDADVIACYNWGDITGKTAGGLVGAVRGSNDAYKITYSYNTGVVKGENQSGQFIGDGGSIDETCYTNVNTSGATYKSDPEFIDYDFQIGSFFVKNEDGVILGSKTFYYPILGFCSHDSGTTTYYDENGPYYACKICGQRLDSILSSEYATPLNFDGDETKLTGSNWMSGISGDRYLNEINIPGAHDAGMARVKTFGNLASASEKYAKTQSQNIYEQMESGVRMLDIRLSNKLNYDFLEDSPVVCHGDFQEILGVENDMRYYALWNDYLTLDIVLDCCKRFLADNPTETVLLDLTYETGDRYETYQLARKNLDEYEDLIYTQNGSKIIKTMPQLKDVRGKVVIFSKDTAMLGCGIKYNTGNGWGTGSIARKMLQYENHYEADDEWKWNYVKAFFNGGALDRWKDYRASTISTKKTNLPKNVKEHLDVCNVVYTSANRAGTLGESPKTIAEYVNPRVYTNNDALFKQRGYLYGWIYSDFVTEEMARVLWLTNYPDDLEYCKVTYVYGDGSSETFQVMKGTELMLKIDSSNPDGSFFDSWLADGESYAIGNRIVINEDITITAQWVKGGSDQPCPRDETCPLTAFTDLNPAQWYHDGIEYCVKNGLMNGVGNNKFDPNGTTSRGMIVTILYRLEGEPEVTAENPFDDVEADRWYTDAVIWAAENEIVGGYGDGKFGPNDDITREQLAAILYRYAQFKGLDVSVGEDTNILDFEDAGAWSDWSVDALQWAVVSGIIQCKDGKLVPKGDASRAEAATMLQRFCENVAE